MDAFEVVKNTLDIFECFSNRNRELTLTEIALKINRSEAETKDLLDILIEKEFLELLQRYSKYRLTHKVYYIGHIAGTSLHFHLRDITIPFMEQIRDNTNQTVNLFLLNEKNRICIEQCKSHDELENLVEVGDLLPLWTGASGRVLLAFQSDDYQKEIFRIIPPHVKVVEIIKDLKKVRTEGYAWSENVRDSGYSAIAFPIYDVDGKAIASISITGLTSTFTREFVDQYEAYLKEKTLAISTQFGYIPE